MPHKKEFLNPEKILKEIDLREGMVLADFGCGAGFFALPAAKWAGESGQVYIIDVKKTSLETVENRAKDLGITNIKPVWADLEIVDSTKIPQKSVDRVVILNLLFQTEKHKEIFEEAKKVLKDNGKIIVIDWKTSSILFGPKVSLRVPEEKVKEMAKEIDLVLEKTFEAGEYHYGLVFRKIK